MRKIEMKYGKKMLSFEIPDKNLVGILKANPVANSDDVMDETAEIKRALSNPIGTPQLSELVSKGEKVVIMASDISRPSPSHVLLPPLLNELSKVGVQDQDIKIIFGMGIHRRHSEDEKRSLVGADIYDRISCVDSNEENYIDLGKTRRGTPVHLCQSIVEADIRICTGNIEYHYFAGYSGGAKAIMPGAANYETIRHNHKLQLNEKAASGVLECNPVRDDIDEIGQILGITFILNVVLNEKKEVAKAFAGDYLEAHRAGCAYLDTLNSISIDAHADIVVVSAGGFPKDINMYQTQKALDNASHAIKTGGVIILLGECPEGYGEDTFEEWINDASKPDDLINRLRKEFVLGGHKAAAIAKVVNKANVLFVSAMPKEDVAQLYFSPFENLQKALDKAFQLQGNDASVLVIPQGGSILPCVREVSKT
ncbi:MAG: nickel-dependent lactate racemase [Bacillota bacterium]|nr:nickel-dependent lactate racemase [Bacillota bacterium]